MHQQVLLSRGRVAVGRLQALVLCVKVCHSHIGFSLTKKPLLQTGAQRTAGRDKGKARGVEGIQTSGIKQKRDKRRKWERFTHHVLVNI